MDDTHLSFTFALGLTSTSSVESSSGRRLALERIHLVDSLYACGPTTLTELDSTDFGELCRAVSNVFDDFAVDVFCELHRSLCTTGRAHPSALARFDKLTAGEKAIRSECLQPLQ